MEVLHRNHSLYLSQSPMSCRSGIQQHVMVMPRPGDVFTCDAYEVRTPTPERAWRTYSQRESRLGTSGNSTKTLLSVLQGDVPPAYSHLTTSFSHRATASPHLTTASPHLSTSSSHFASLHKSPAITNSGSILCVERDSLYPALSPSLSVYSSTSYNSRPSSRESYTSVDSLSDCQTEPMDLSCKRTSRKRSAASALLDVSSSKKLALSSSLPVKASSSRTSSGLSSYSSSISPPVASMQRHPPSPTEGQAGGEFSLLRNLLSMGKHNHTSSASILSHSTPNLTSDRVCDSPASDSFPRTLVTGNTKVQLAKKNLLPVSARVSDWVVKIVKFAKSIPEFSALSHNDKITLILNSWTRIMLLYMAESNFHFAVTPSPAGDLTVHEVAQPKDEPTMKAVEGLQGFIRKCQQMAVDGKEYEFFRMLVLFNSGYPGLSNPDKIDQISSMVQQLLQQHVCVSRPKDVMHYSRLLMCLPSLYSTNSQMFESLFCKHITKNTDMQVLLKELLQSIS